MAQPPERLHRKRRVTAGRADGVRTGDGMGAAFGGRCVGMALRKGLPWRRLAVVMAVAVIAATALALRTLRLEDRPVHPDEANQAWKLGELLETGAYRYDPHDHHGPALYYLAWPLVRLQSGGVFAASAMAFYRLTPALFGVALAITLVVLLAHRVVWPRLSPRSR